MEGGGSVRVVVASEGPSAGGQAGGEGRRTKEGRAAYVTPKRRDERGVDVPTPQRLFPDHHQAPSPASRDGPRRHGEGGILGRAPGQARSRPCVAAAVADPEAGMQRLSVNHEQGKGREKPKHGGKGREHQSKGRQHKPKNTESFEPDGRKDMNVVVGRGHKPSLREDKRGYTYNVQDVVMVPELFCEEEDASVYSRLISELRAACPEGGPEAGVTLEKGREGLWVMWHGDTHCIADDKKMGGKWKALSPTFTKVIDRMSEYFDMDVKATRFNWYRRQDDWKPYHHDRAAFTPNCPQNITVAASFGVTRDIGFQHAKTRTVVNFPQPNGCCYAFGRDVNVEWKHGVLPMRQVDAERGAAGEFAGGRVSIIAWGWVDMEEIPQ